MAEETVMNNIGWLIEKYPSLENLGPKFNKETSKFNPPLCQEDLEKVIFKEKIKIVIPMLKKYTMGEYGYKILQDYGPFKQGDWVYTTRDFIEIYPNTPEGSTVAHILKTCYLNTWKVDENEKRPLYDLVEKHNSIFRWCYFEGISKYDDYWEMDNSTD